MTIPVVIHEEIDRALENVRQHPQHEYMPKARDTLFKLLKKDSVGANAWKWLAIFAAQRVLPIYEDYIKETERKFYYDIKMPQKSLAMAEGVLLGKVTSIQGYNYANAAYEQSDFDYKLIKNPVPFKVYMSSWAASIALLEVSKPDVDQFSMLPNFGYHSNGFSMGQDVGKEIEKMFSDGVSGENFTNILWALSGHSDSAASACTAWSCEDNSKAIIPIKQLEFWTWWLTEGIQAAWERAMNA